MRKTEIKRGNFDKKAADNVSAAFFRIPGASMPQGQYFHHFWSRKNADELPDRPH